jgi:tubulin polyglutamylase TTLL2
MLKYKVDKVYPTIIRYVLEKRGWVKAKDNEPFDLYWRNGRFPEGLVRASGPKQRFNHFINSGLITRKAGMTHYLKYMRKRYGDMYDYTPPSIVINKENQAEICSKLQEQTTKRMWIVKPSNGSQGRGIKLVSDLSAVELPSDRIYTAQLYIQNPWLLQGYKFDIRLYALVTSFHPLTIHLYKEGLVRFATKKYDGEMESPDAPGRLDTFKHLTNTSINKHSPLFISLGNQKKVIDEATQALIREAQLKSTFEADITNALGLGSQSKRTLRQLLSYMHKHGIDYRPIWQEIEKIVILTLLPLAEHVPKTDARCFELYGFDILLDDHLKPWLIEVNFSPSLGGDSTTDQTVKEGLIEDVIDTLDFRAPSRHDADVDSPHQLSSSSPSSSTSALESNDEYVKEYDRFMSRTPYTHREQAFKNGGVGNFDTIFPFNEETRDAATRIGEQDDIENQKDRIVSQVKSRYGKFVPSPRQML